MSLSKFMCASNLRKDKKRDNAENHCPRNKTKEIKTTLKPIKSWQTTASQTVFSQCSFPATTVNCSLPGSPSLSVSQLRLMAVGTGNDRDGSEVRLLGCSEGLSERLGNAFLYWLSLVLLFPRRKRKNLVTKLNEVSAGAIRSSSVAGSVSGTGIE